MDFTGFVDQITEQADALRAAAVAAGPQAPVPSCPNWTVSRLIGHIGGVHSWTLAALRADPAGESPGRQPRPESTDFAEVLGWWDTTRAKLIGLLRTLGPDAPAWTMNSTQNAAFWARRQAHETAIHRLDAELAAGTATPLVFDPVFAADGIDELLTTMMVSVRRPYGGRLAGTVLVHAADAGRQWLVAVAPGEQITITEQPAPDADASITGTADAVYRVLWGRPGGAVTSGDVDLLAVLAAP